MTNRINLMVLVFTILFSFGFTCVALAGDAVRLLVEISYPCEDNQDVCDTGEAVSREVDGDKVNVYITLLASNDNPATAGPNGEPLETFTATCTSNLGSINPNSFASDGGIASFNGEAAARAYVDYTGSAPGKDQITCVVPSLPDPLVGTADVNVATSSSVEVVEPTEDATAIITRKEGPQAQDGVQIGPCGEAIIQFFANGLLSTSKNIEINFGEGVVEKAELRTLDSDQPLPVPFSLTLRSGDVRRYVVYSPTKGPVVIEVIDLASEPLDPSNLSLYFCGHYHPPFVEIFCDETFLCPGVDCLVCGASTINSSVEGPYTWELNGVAAYTGDSMEICPENLNDGYNTLIVTDTTNNFQDSKTIEFNGPDCCGTIDVTQDTVLRSRWFPSVALITVNGSDTLWQMDNYEIEYAAEKSRDLFVLPGTLPWLNPVKQTIYQLIIILPVWWAGCCFDGLTEIMTIEVCNTVTDCCDNDQVRISMLPLELDQ